MDTSRISFGEMVAAASGAALLVVMFFPWYGENVEFEGGGEVLAGNFNAWEVFGFIDLLLFAVAVVAIGMAVVRATGSMPANLPAPPGLIVAGAGAFALLLILLRLVSPPDLGPLGEVELSRKIGIFLGLLAAGGITFGGYTAANERASGEAPPAASGEAPPA